jgi:uncharacterized membrane protein YgcG
MKTRLVTALCSLMLTAGVQLFAQDQQAPPPDQQNPQAAQPQQTFSPEQLDSLVAPIALYPDSLLSQVLVACTYPLELVEANQWLQQNGRLQGTALVEAAQQQNWDPSIQALVPFQDVIKRLNSDIRWTTDLGNAFLAQQADVMNAVQQMRARARDNGKLADTEQEHVTVEDQGGQQAIVIQPADPQVVYVPVYNPDYFWGAPGPYGWPGLYYPGVGFGWGWGGGVNVGLFFGGCCGWGGWGWGPGWFDHRIVVNNYFFHRYNFHEYGGAGFRGNVAWAHDPGHREGVPYANRGVAQRYGGENFRGGAPRYDGASNSFRPGNETRSPQQSVGGSRGFAPPSNNNHSAFGGVENGSRARVQSDHGFSSMGSGRTAPAFRGGGGGGGGGARPSGGGGHAGGGRR